MSNFLAHHGILGMKWGVRRYQNEDGSLSPAGEKRYKTIGEVAEKSSKILSDATRLGSGSKTKKTRKDYSDLTDVELQKRVNRLNLEENYGRLTGNTKMVRSGSEWTREILQDTAIAVGMAGTAVSIYLALKKKG